MVTAYFHRTRQGKPLVHPDPTLGEAANFLYMMDAEKAGAEKVSTVDLCYTLHADHGMNASTFSARVTIATLSDMYSAITSAIGHPKKAPSTAAPTKASSKCSWKSAPWPKWTPYIDDCLAQKKKIMGIGHRVYKTIDPRAPQLKRMAQVFGGQSSATPSGFRSASASPS